MDLVGTREVMGKATTQDKDLARGWSVPAQNVMAFGRGHQNAL